MKLFFAAAFVLGFTANAFSASSSSIHHVLSVKLNPETSQIAVTDQVRLPIEFCAAAKSSGESIEFYLHPGLTPKLNGLTLKAKANSAKGEVKALAYNITPNETCSFSLQYDGKIKHPVRENHSPGTIESQGASLFGSTFWHPQFEDHLVTFELNVSLPEGWSYVSQGEAVNESTWQESQPQDAIYLIAAQFHIYKKNSNAVDAQVYLRTADEKIAQNYLRLTDSYVQMYSEMLGPYPYKKFALVENFWETGFGMPSFTLLGSQVLRLPFIAYTSYPHEILHNWWGNSVYIDFENGNWAEGLTSYLADHHLSVQRGQGQKYRRQILQNYQAYTSKSDDFPLNQFRSRHNSSSQAIGYGKSAHFFHMLRVQFGDELFFNGLKHFYRTNKFRLASYSDLKTSFETVAATDLSNVFEQWVTRTGAPKIEIIRAEKKRINIRHTLNNKTGQDSTNDYYQIALSLAQTQIPEKYALTIPYKLHFSDKTEESGLLSMVEKQQSWQLTSARSPVAISIDPQFDVFRHIYPQESPATFANSFGEKQKVTLILPKALPTSLPKVFPSFSPMASPKALPNSNDSNKLYLAFAQKLSQHLKSRNPSLEIQVIQEGSMNSLPSSGAIWILGWNNRFIDEIQKRLISLGADLSTQELNVTQGAFKANEHSVFLTLTESQNSNQTISWVGLNDRSDISALARKIPHYGSYSYLAFDQDSKNQLKAQWPVKASPLKVDF